MMIKAFEIYKDPDTGFEIQPTNSYRFDFSRNGNIKFIGKFKNNYLKKEKLNSYTIVELCKRNVFLFSDDFNIDFLKCKNIIISHFIANTESEIKRLNSHLEVLKKEREDYERKNS